MNPSQRPNWKVAAAFGTLAGATVGGFVIAAPERSAVTPNELILEGGLASPARPSAPVPIATTQPSGVDAPDVARHALASASPPMTVVAPPAPADAESAPSPVTPASAASPTTPASAGSPASAASPVTPASAGSPMSAADPVTPGSPVSPASAASPVTAASPVSPASAASPVSAGIVGSAGSGS